MKIKICGLTRPQDAILAHELGATELGFIFCESPRRVTVLEVEKILSHLPKSVNTVGVFKDSPLKVIIDSIDHLSLRSIQLHGNESVAFVQELKQKRPAIMIIKAILEKNGAFLQDHAAFDQIDFLLFDSAEKKLLSSEVETTKPFFLAGSLNNQNVRSMIQKYRPQGVDVSSGIESSPGIKDEFFMRDFFSAIKGII